MSSKSSYTERFRASLHASGMDVGQLAAALGVTYQGVKKVYDGLSKMFSADNNVRAAKLLHVDSEWLATGEGVSRPVPLSDELLVRLRRLPDGEAARLENELRVRFEMPLLHGRSQAPAPDPQPAKAAPIPAPL